VAIDRVVKAWGGGAGSAIAASYGGVRSHPVLLGRSVWKDIPDEGARELVSEFVHCDDLRPPGDVDYPDDLKLREA
jgi:nicotine blue oxidoreductase